MEGAGFDEVEVIPAHAGVILRSMDSMKLSLRNSRTRGGDPQDTVYSLTIHE